MLNVTDAARDAISDQGYDPVYGARPLKRVIQNQIANPLAVALIKSSFENGQTVTVDYQDGEFVIAELQ